MEVGTEWVAQWLEHSDGLGGFSENASLDSDLLATDGWRGTLWDKCLDDGGRRLTALVVGWPCVMGVDQY